MQAENTSVSSDVKILTSRILSDTNSRELANLYILRGHAFYSLGRRVESTEDFFKAFELSDEPTQICHAKSMISLALLDAGEKEQAIWWAVAAIDSDPDSDEGHFTFGLICYYSEFPKAAVQAFREVMRISPNHSRARLEMARSLRESCNLSLAVDELEKYVLENPEDPIGHFELAWTLHVFVSLNDRVPRAVKYYQDALNLNPTPSLKERIENKLRALDSIVSGG